MRKVFRKVIDYLWTIALDNQLLIAALGVALIALVFASIDTLVFLGLGVLALIFFLFWIITNIIK